MPVDPDDLAVAALRAADGSEEALSNEDRETLAALRRAAMTVRAVTDADRELEDPPADLWSRIEATALAEDGAHGQAVNEDSGPADAKVVDLAERRARRNRTLVAVAAVAAAVLLIAGVAGVLLRDDGTYEVVASADLSLLAGGGSGSAELVEKDDGLHLVLDVSDLEPAQQADFYELWLLAPDVSDMASLTRFESDSAEIDVRLPEGVDPTEFPVVDISEEVDDGDDTHSGLSILRGELA